MEEIEKEIGEIRRIYKNTDQWLKAPNGKSSNLPEKLWLLVRTPSFKKLFGDWETLAYIKETDGKIAQLLNKDKDTSKGVQREVIGKAGTREIELLKKELGIDVSEYNHTLDKSGINHARKNHSNEEVEAKRGQVALSEDDFKLIPYIIKTPDTLEYSGKNNKGLETIKYFKELNGVVVIVEEVRTGKKELAFNTMYKKKPGSGRLQKPSAPTSETTSLNNNISNFLISVNHENISKNVDENGEPLLEKIEETCQENDNFSPEESEKKDKP